LIKEFIKFRALYHYALDKEVTLEANSYVNIIKEITLSKRWVRYYDKKIKYYGDNLCDVL
jgi:hypothetical protein